MTACPRAVARFGLAALEKPVEPAPRPPRNLAPEDWMHRPRRRTVVRLWLPLSAIAVLLSPVPLLLAPLAWLAPAPFRPANPYSAVLAIGRVLLSLGGAVIEVDTPDARVSVRLY